MSEAWRDQLSQLRRRHAEQRGLEPVTADKDDDFDLDSFVRQLGDVVQKGRALRIAVTAFLAAVTALAGQLGINWLSPPETVPPQQIAAAVAAYEIASDSPAPPSPATSEPTAVAGPRLTASLEIEGPTTATPGDLIVLEARGDSEAVRWFLGNSPKTFLPVDGGKRVVFASGTPGEYRFFAVGATVDAGKISLDDDTHTVVIGTPGPAPVPPNPTPNPTPVPVPPEPTPTPPSPPAPVVKVSGLLAAVVIRDAATITADQTEVIVDLRTWADAQDQSKAALYVFDDDAKEAQAATYRKAMPANARLPYAFLVDFGAKPKAAVLWSGELPKQASEIIAKAEELLK